MLDTITSLFDFFGYTVMSTNVMGVMVTARIYKGKTIVYPLMALKMFLSKSSAG